jgi:hypothetical protein
MATRNEIEPARRKSPRGRKTSCTQDAIDRYCEALRKHLPKHLCANYAGVSAMTVRTWFERAEEGEEPYASFALAARQAESDAAKVLMTRISRASRDPKHWKAAAWLLEHRYGIGVSAKATVEVKVGSDGQPVRYEPLHVINAEDIGDPVKLATGKVERIYTDLQRARENASHVAVSRLNDQLDEAIEELRAAKKKAAEGEGLTAMSEPDFLAELTAAAEAMPEAHLRAFVDVWLERHRMKAVPAE